MSTLDKEACYYLKANVIAEPLIDQWYAWSYLIPPATSARYLTQSQFKVMQSFIDAPEVHEQTLQNPAMLGGPFIQHAPSRVGEVRSLLEKTKKEQSRLLALSDAIAQLQSQLAAHPPGDSLESLYDDLPPALKGYVELVYDAQNNPNIRFIEGLLYRSEYYDSSRQSLALHMGDCDQRAFVMSTPRLPDDKSLFLSVPFADPRLDQLFAMRHTPGSVEAIAQQLSISSQDRSFFNTLFTTEPPKRSDPYKEDAIRVRYFGHACVLIETDEVSILCDPLVSYEHPTGVDRYSFADLPDLIDYALITHNHQDHVMFETLLQLRHKIQHVVVPSGQKGSLLDPSLKLVLQQIGFSNFITLDELETLPLPDGQLISLPVLGEHGDLDIATKTAYWIQIKGRSILCAADSNNLDSQLYAHIHHLFGDLDMLFIGMECDGAPFTWAYAPLLPKNIPHRQAQTRRLDGSNANRAQSLIDQLNPQQVYVYAMGQEPWLTYITSIDYAPDDAPIVESDKLIERCREQGRVCDRPFGKKQIILTSKPAVTKYLSPIPVTSTLGSYDYRKSSPHSPTSPLPHSPTPSTSPLTSLLTKLNSLNIRLWLDGNTLRCNAPKGTLTPALTTQLKEHKPEIIALLKGSNQPSPTQKQTQEPTWQQDIHLPESICPTSITPSSTPPLPHSPTPFLTGATGFLGAFLLYELLQQTQTTVYCLVREHSSSKSGLSKLRDCLSNYKLWDDSFESRLITITGDLSRPHLGLSEQDFPSLSEQIDAIYHNGAQVHHLSPYGQLRSTNVLGTIEILKLACHGTPKPLHYTSTLSVFPPTPLPGKTAIFEQDDISQYPVPVGGYNRSKWVAEQLVTQARDRHLPVTIYRPGPLSGHSQTGVFNPNDFLYRLMQGYLQSGMAPQGNLPLDLLPVDFAAKAIIYLSKQPSALGKAFHLIHPHPASSDLLFNACRSAGHQIKRVPYDTWHQKLQQIAQNDPSHPLYPLVALFSSRQNTPIQPPTPKDTSKIPFSTTQAYQHLKDAPFNLPPLNQALFNTYLKAMTPAISS
ncbi:MAG: thioester reductase domain-containing protein [Cyanobacteria bacterium J06623_4]